MTDNLISLNVSRCRRCRRGPCPDCGAKEREGLVAYVPQLFDNVPKVDRRKRKDRP